MGNWREGETEEEEKKKTNRARRQKQNTGGKQFDLNTDHKAHLKGREEQCQGQGKCS